MSRIRERTSVALPLAFAGAVLVPCAALVFFGARAILLEARFADTRREDRLRGAAGILSRQVDLELERLRESASQALWPFREPVYEAREAERAVADFAARHPRVSCGVVFTGKGVVVAPAVPHVRAPRRPLDGGGIFAAALAPRPGETPENYHRRLLEKINQLQGLEDAQVDAGPRKDPASALAKIAKIKDRPADTEVLLRALHQEAQIRLSRGEAAEAARLLERLVGTGENGPAEKGMALRATAHLLWAEAEASQGTPARSLEILFWLWRELIDGRYGLELEDFQAAEADLSARVRVLLDGAPGDRAGWEQRLRDFRGEGERARARAAERRLLATQVLPRVLLESPAGLGRPAWFRALLEDRLEVFLYVPPVRFAEGLPEGASVGAGFRVDLDAVVRETVLPLLRTFDTGEASLALLDHRGRSLGPGVPGPGAVEVPLAEPLGAWRISASAGSEDPEARRARALTWIHVGLVAASVIAVFGAGVFMIRSVRREAELARLRAEFVASVTHDLKTPVTSIRMFAETLAMGRVKDEEKARQYVGFIGTEVGRLERLIDDILEFARIEAGRKVYDLQPLDLARLAGEVVGSFRPGAQASGFTVEAALEPVPAVSGEEEAIRRALWNLLSNAVKFSVEEKRIEVRLRAEGATAVLEVRDHGIGLTARDRKRLFEKFFRGEEAQRRGLPGTGLGLSLVRHVMRNHNGRAEVDSEPGRGSTFRLVFPCEGAGERGGSAPGGERG